MIETFCGTKNEAVQDLDMTHQIDILDLLFDLNEQENRTIVMVLHDINLACRYAHHIVAVKEGHFMFMENTSFIKGRV